VNIAAWSGLELAEPLTGGARNQVRLARRGGERLVVRRSSRPAASLDWELDLLAYLDGHGISVPRPVPADDGRRHVAGVLVQRFIDGHPPRGDRDWQRVVAVLTAIHELTAGWPQRPGFAASTDLLTAERGGDVRLDLMPADAVAIVRAAWRPILSGQRCAIHADVGTGNLLIDGDRVSLLDWDEARVDVPWFDFAFVPDGVEVPSPVDRDTLATAGLAWETATCWAPEPVYAARCLAELRSRVGP
jgi:Ser/Thr protein kinase RdoA (MazF antagonist)